MYSLTCLVGAVFDTKHRCLQSELQRDMLILFSLENSSNKTLLCVLEWYDLYNV